MIKLLDTTINIIFKADSPDRLENLKLSYLFLKSNFIVNINIIEVGIKSHKENLNLECNDRVQYSFIYDCGKEMNMTKYRNLQIANCKTRYLGLWDTDVLISKKQIKECLGYLRSGKYAVCLPYDGRLIELNSILKSIYTRSLNFKLIESILKNAEPMYGNISVGAAIFFNTQFYISAGMDNRHFKKWGHDDIERVKRSEILGVKIARIPGAAYHLYHPRFSYKTFEEEEVDRSNSRSEYLKVSSMTQKELTEYINDWNQ